MISRTALGLALLCAPAIVQAQVPDGRALFQQGRAYYDAGRYADALQSFRASLAALPSPNTRLYIGRCLRALGQNADAYREFIAAATEANARRASEERYARTADAATAEAVALTDRVAFVRVEVPEAAPSMTVTLNGRPLDASEFQTSVAIDGRSATIEAVAPGRVPYRATSDVPPGQQARFVVRFPQGAVVDVSDSVSLVSVRDAGNGPHVVGSSRGVNGWRVAGIVTLSVGAALGVAGVLTGLNARSIDDRLATECPGGACSPTISGEQRSLIDEGRTMVTLTNASFIAGGALAAFGVVALIVSLSDGGESFAPGLARVSPFVDPARGAAGLGLTGRF